VIAEGRSEIYGFRRSRTPRHRRLTVRLVSLPDGHHPNSFFPAGGHTRQFQALLESATL